MPAPEVWGPPTWTLFHVMAEKVNEQAYPLLRDKMLTMIKMICKNLPCPYCATDATMFLNKINLADLKTKITQLPDTDVLNGIAYNPKTKTIFVTGKNWDKMFEIRITQ